MRFGVKLYKDFLKEVFPQYERVRKVALNAGFSCPNLDGTVGVGGCAYCNNRSFSLVAKTELSVMEQLESGIKNAPILAYFQSYTNTYASIEKLHEIFMPVILHSKVAGLAIGTRPDCLNLPIVELLAKLNKIKPVIVEIGVQTANNKTLKKINRSHTAECTIDAAALCKSSGLLITAHIIIGLPGETSNNFENTANLVKDCKFSSIKIHPLHIAKGTEFAKQYKEGKIELLSMEAYCQAAAKVIQIMQPHIAIERVSAECPSEMLLAPEWCGNREEIWSLIEKRLAAGFGNFNNG
jgi:radical SAM protein (TIGR01212 family)